MGNLSKKLDYLLKSGEMIQLLQNAENAIRRIGKAQRRVMTHSRNVSVSDASEIGRS